MERKMFNCELEILVQHHLMRDELQVYLFVDCLNKSNKQFCSMKFYIFRNTHKANFNISYHAYQLTAIFDTKPIYTDFKSIHRQSSKSP